MFNCFCFSSRGHTGSSRSGSSHKPVPFQRAKTNGLMSKGTKLVNETGRTLFLRDKVGPAYGDTRYKIPGKSCIEVFPLQHTFFTMIAYAVEEEDSIAARTPPAQNSNANLSPQAQNSRVKPKKQGKDTKLSIDSDQLVDNKTIRISYNEARHEYDIKLSPR